jgi:putative ABC transport system permease protein
MDVRIAADYSLDREALFYTIAISACTGLLVGIAPALRLATEDVATAVKDGARGAAGTKHGRRFSSLLVVTETALAVVLLAGAGVMVRSFFEAV